MSEDKPQATVEKKAPSQVFKDIGWAGLKYQSGQIAEDPEQELRGQRGAQIFHDMRYSDATVSAVLMALSLPIRQAKWQVNPATDAPDDIAAAEFVEQCLYDMSTSFDAVLAEVSSMFCFGWAYLEWVLKRRLGRQPGSKGLPSSAYSDGRIGFRKISLRAQTSLYEWSMDEQGGIRGMVQEMPKGQPKLIPIEKSLLFRTSVEGNNPEGMAVLRPSYRDYKYKREIERIEAIGLQRAMMGVPVVTLGQGATSTASLGVDSHEHQAEDIIAGMYANNMLGVIEDADRMTFRFESPNMTGITGDSGRVIQRKDEAIARSALASWLLLGTRERGSYALARELGDMFFIAVDGFLAMISQVFTRWAVPVLFDYNTLPVTAYPEVTTSLNRRVDLEAISQVINNLVGSQVITPDEVLEQHIRELAGLPRRVVQITAEGEPITPAPAGPTETQVTKTVVEEPDEESRRGHETFARERTPIYGPATDAYQETLEADFEAWADRVAESFATSDPEKTDLWYAEEWEKAVLALMAILHERAWEYLPRGFELGYKSASLPPDLRVKVDEELVQNDIYMDANLYPAIRDRVSLRDLQEIGIMEAEARKEAMRTLLLGKRSHVSRYAGAFWRIIWLGAIEYWTREGWGGPVRWITDPLAKHCPTCLLFGDITYRDLQALLTYTGGILPGQGTECDGFCRCGIARDEGGTWLMI